MDEESSKKFQTFINFKKLNELINSDDKGKDHLIESNYEEFNKIYNILSGKVELPNEIKLIGDIQDMDIKKNFNYLKKINS